MKINIHRIPPEGLSLKEEISPVELQLNTDTIEFIGMVAVNADLFKVTNLVSARVSLSGLMRMRCSRCLNTFDVELKKNLELNYPVNKLDLEIDLEPDIREEIILDYPIKPLCHMDCKGLCPKCGINLNEGVCNCGTA